MSDDAKGAFLPPVFTPDELFMREPSAALETGHARIDVLVVYPRAFFTIDVYL